MNLGQNHLVIQFLQFPQQLIDQRQRFLVVLIVDVQTDETSFEVLFEEDALLGFRPFRRF